MHHKRERFWLLVALLLVVGIISAAIGAKANAAEVKSAGVADASTPTPIAPVHVVISEFRTRGPNGDSDEFIELYNPTGAAVDIGSWSIRRSSDCGLTQSSVLTITSNMVLQAGQHYLLLSQQNSSLSGADQVFFPSLTDAGGIALFNTDGDIVDAVGMCLSTAFREGANLEPLLGNANQSYERRPGGATACYDIGSNDSDFVLISPAQPQNRNFPITLCNGVATYTPTQTATRTPTRTATRTATTIPGFVIIYEFLPHPTSDWNDDGVVNVGDEYIELINLSTSPVSIQNWKLDNGANTPGFTLPDIDMQPRQIKVFFRFETNIPISDGGGTIRLVKSDGRTADLFNYPPVEAPDQTWCRLFSGSGFLTFGCTPTPGRPNLLANPTPVATPTAATPVLLPECNLSDTVPQAITSTECGGTGGQISEIAPAAPLRISNRWKWPAFIQ